MSAESHPGDTFAGHLIEAEIGRGGMGLVFRAHNISLDRRRAIKVIAPRLSADPAFAARFRRESRLAASVEHPNVVPVHHAGEEGGLLYIVMSFIDGVDLARVLDDGPLEAARASAIVTDIAAALDAAHAAGLVHRDIKPANVLLAEAPDGSERVYLTDFGISKPLQPETPGDATASTALTGTGQVLGTADYTAPEQIESGRADARSDTYSLACVAFQALTGKRPFHRETELATLIAHTKAPRPSAAAAAPALSAEVDTLLQAGMAIEPAERPASAGEFARGLDAALLGGGAAASSGRAHRGSRSMAAAGLGLVTAVIAAVVAVLVVGGGDDMSSPPSEEPTVATSPPGAVGEQPVSVSVGEVRVWVASHGGDQIDRLRKGRPEKYSTPIPLNAPAALTVGFESIWVVNGDALYRLDPGEGGKPLRIPVGSKPEDVAVDPNFVWVSNEGDDTVMRIDPTTNKVSATVDVADAPEGLATGKGAVFVADTAAGQVTKIDAQSAKVLAEEEVSPSPTALAVATRGIWVVDESANVLMRLSPTTLKPLEPSIVVAPQPSGVAVGLGSVWVSSEGGDEVQRFDPADGDLQGDPIPVGVEPADVAIGTSAVYTANSGDATVTRIAP